jgi:hypothetical protein
MFLKFIKKLFPAEESESITYNLAEIDKIYEELYSKYLKEQVLPNFESINSNLKEILKQLRERCAALKDAKLKNPNISLREKQVMEGNRSSYINHALHLAELVEIPNDISEAQKSYASLKENLDYFVKQTQKPRQVLMYFFEHEANAIHKLVGDINSNFDNLYQLVNDEKQKNFNELKAQILKISHNKNRSVSLKSEIKDFDKAIKELSSNLAKANKDLEAAKAGDEYKKYISLQSSKESTEAKLKSMKNDLDVNIAKIDRALKKYERISVEYSSIVKGYLENSLLTLKSDSEHKIIAILNNIVEKLNNNSIDVKDKERDKLISDTESIINSGYFAKARDNFLKNEEEKEKIDSELADMSILAKIKNLEEQAALNEKLLADKKSFLDKAKAELKVVSEDNPNEKIRELLEKVTKKKVALS